MNHELKIWPQYFCRVNDGTKTFEVRENDRGFQCGDIVTLKEWDPTLIHHADELPIAEVDHWSEPRGYTGNSLEFEIGYIFPLSEKTVVFSLLKRGNHS